MTEDEWHNCRDAPEMYAFLRDTTTRFRTRWVGWLTGRRFSISERKWRLLLVACCQRIMELIPTEPSRALIGVYEDYADEVVDSTALEMAIVQSMLACEDESYRRVANGEEFAPYERHAINAIARLHRSEEEGRAATLSAAAAARAWQIVPNGPHRMHQRAWDEETGQQAELMRCIIGNPFHPRVLPPDLRTWHGGVLLEMAQQIYRERRWEDLPILADALEDAGCVEVDMLEHCRGMSAHARGCWVIDLLRGLD